MHVSIGHATLSVAPFTACPGKTCTKSALICQCDASAEMKQRQQASQVIQQIGVLAGLRNPFQICMAEQTPACEAVPVHSNCLFQMCTAPAAMTAVREGLRTIQ